MATCYPKWTSKKIAWKTSKTHWNQPTGTRCVDKVDNLHFAAELTSVEVIGNRMFFKDNIVDWEEWRTTMKDRGIPDAEIEAMFAKYDLDGDMVLNADERQKLEADLMKQKERLDRDIEVSKN